MRAPTSRLQSSNRDVTGKAKLSLGGLLRVLQSAYLGCRSLSEKPEGSPPLCTPPISWKCLGSADQEPSNKAIGISFQMTSSYPPSVFFPIKFTIVD